MLHKLGGVWLVITPLILNLSAGWRWVVNFGPRAIVPYRLQYPYIRRAGWPWSWPAST